MLTLSLSLSLLVACDPPPTDEPFDGGADARIPSAVCGNGVVEAGEECDDGNADELDDCRSDCTAPTCHPDTCFDGEPCNGAERCEGTRCVSAPSPLDDGTPCAVDGIEDGVCLAGACRRRACGNGLVDQPSEQCDDGNDDDDDGCRSDCTWTCDTPDDERCQDGDVCNGAETCDLATHTCQAGTSLVCDDGDDCTVDSCDPALGCVFELIDEDGDGHAPTTLGACGTDCDDARADVYEGAPEICDTRDNDCNGVVDDGVPTWYPDCDHDGFAAAGAIGVEQCEAPTSGPSGCASGGWTTRNPDPSLNAVDCAPNDPSRHPGATEIVGDEVDQDCDGRELCWLDADNDGFRPPPGAASTRMSMDLDCRDPYEATSTRPATDCCDTDARAYPGATSFYSTPRTGCGGFDFDCNGVEEARYGVFTTCPCETCDWGAICAQGWQTVRPTCGEPGTLIVCQRRLPTSCGSPTQVANASCR